MDFFCFTSITIGEKITKGKYNYVVVERNNKYMINNKEELIYEKSWNIIE